QGRWVSRPRGVRRLAFGIPNRSRGLTRPSGCSFSLRHSLFAFRHSLFDVRIGRAGRNIPGEMVVFHHMSYSTAVFALVCTLFAGGLPRQTASVVPRQDNSIPPQEAVVKLDSKRFNLLKHDELKAFARALETYSQRREKY